MINCVFLGTGTSVGVPVIGCDCAVCSSADKHNRRRRSSLYVVANGCHIIIDTPPDFREQVLEHGVERVDAVFFTHAHADHLFGFDDIRRFNTLQQMVIPVWASVETCSQLRNIFAYALRPDPVPGVFRPRVLISEITERVSLQGVDGGGQVTVTPLPVEHGICETLGFRIDAGGRSLGYVPDCKQMNDDVTAMLQGVDVMILDGLRRRPHPTHYTLAESLEKLAEIGASRSYVVHICHEIDHAQTAAELPSGVALSYDGLRIGV